MVGSLACLPDRLSAARRLMKGRHGWVGFPGPGMRVGMVCSSSCCCCFKACTEKRFFFQPLCSTTGRGAEASVTALGGFLLAN